jgi:putative transport protein
MKRLGRINLFSFGLGMALGLLLGMTTFELPGNVTFKLGYAGGPIIIGLLLGALRRTGPVVWTLPYSANFNPTPDRPYSVTRRNWRELRS